MRDEACGWAWQGEIAELERLVDAALAAPLPGAAAHLRMAVVPRAGWRPGELDAASRDAAALLIVAAHPGGPRVILTQRAEDLAQHGGQVSLPGGRVEPGETLVAAAVREAHEEIGLDPALVRVKGPLTPIHIPVSGFNLHPFVALVDACGPWRRAHGEVARVLEVPLADLLDPARLHDETWPYRGRDYRVRSFRVQDAVVWGATAMILSEFLWAIGRPVAPMEPSSEYPVP